MMIRRADDAALGLSPCREHVLQIAEADLDPGVMAAARRRGRPAERLGTDPDGAAVQSAMRASAEHLVTITTQASRSGQNDLAMAIAQSLIRTVVGTAPSVTAQRLSWTGAAGHGCRLILQRPHGRHPDHRTGGMQRTSNKPSNRNMDKVDWTAGRIGGEVRRPERYPQARSGMPRGL
jgi:hypothetical protein